MTPNLRLKLSRRGGRLKGNEIYLDGGRRTTQRMRDSLGRAKVGNVPSSLTASLRGLVMDTTAPNSVALLDARIRRLAVVFGLVVLGILLLFVFAWTRIAQPEQLRLHTLSIVDEKGVERVRIGGELPDAVVNGKRVPRGDRAAGVLIYDDAGLERGGYVTFSRSKNAVLTLDTRKGMVVLLAADSSEGAALRLWGSNFASWLDLRAGSASPRLTVGRENEIVLQQPPMSAGDIAATCSEMKSELSRLTVQPPVQELMRGCKEHMPDAACRACLGIR